MTESKNTEEDLHVAALRAFARERGVSESDAVEIYRREVECLRASAKVRSFISVIAMRLAKDALRARTPDEDVHA